MQEHVNDPYVQQAKKDGWRSRAAFKLLEIDAKPMPGGKTTRGKAPRRAAGRATAREAAKRRVVRRRR